MAYRLVIFDFDGTLADSLPWFLEVLDAIADEYGFKRVRPEDHARLRTLTAREIIETLEVPAWRLPQIALRLQKMMHADIHRVPLFPGVPQMLADLKAAGVRTVLVTSNAEANARTVLGREACGLIDGFDCGASLFGKAAKFKKAMREAGVRPEETLCVGDELRDLDAAHAVGARFGAVAWGYNALETLRAAGSDHLYAEVCDIALSVRAACAA